MNILKYFEHYIWRSLPTATNWHNCTLKHTKQPLLSTPLSDWLLIIAHCSITGKRKLLLTPRSRIPEKPMVSQLLTKLLTVRLTIVCTVVLEKLMAAWLAKEIAAVYGTKVVHYRVNNSPCIILPSEAVRNLFRKFRTFEDALWHYPATGPLLSCSDFVLGSQRTVLIRRITTYNLQERTCHPRDSWHPYPPRPRGVHFRRKVMQTHAEYRSFTYALACPQVATLPPLSPRGTLHGRAVRLGNTTRFGPQPSGGTMSKSAVLNGRKATAWTRTGATDDKLSADTSWRLLQ